MRKMACLGLCFLLCSCISLYEQNYQSHGVEIDTRAHREPSLVVSENYEADRQRFVNNGLVLMGESIVEEHAHGINRDEILEFAKKSARLMCWWKSTTTIPKAGCGHTPKRKGL